MEKEIFMTYGPSWKPRSALSYFPRSSLQMPDAVNCGPVFIPEVNVENIWNSTVEDTKPAVFSALKRSLKMSKEFKKFPLAFLAPCSQALRWCHSSNCLSSSQQNLMSSFTINDTDHIIFGEPWKDSTIIKIGTISGSEQKEFKPIALSHFKSISKCQKFNHVDSAVINDTPYILVNADDSLNLLRMEDDSFSMYSLSFEGSYSCLNKSMSDTIGFASSDSSIHIYNIVKEKSLWSGEFLCDELLGCEFGSHPLHLLIGAQSSIMLVDGRMSSRSNVSRKVFDFYEMGQYIHKTYSKQVICSFKNVPNKPFMYVGCSNTIFLMDTRFCKQPVLTWSHMLIGKPSFPHLLKYGDINSLLVVDPPKSQLCFVPTEWEGDDYPLVKSPSPPLHNHLVRDILKFGKSNGILMNKKLEKYLASSIVGMTYLPTFDGNGGTVFTQNAFGNIFLKRHIIRKEKNFNRELEERAVLRSLQLYDKESSSITNLDSLNEENIDVQHIEDLKVKRSHKETSIRKSSFCPRYWDLHYVISRSSSKFGEGYIFDDYAKQRIENEDSVNNFFDSGAHDLISDEYINNCTDDFSKSILSTWQTKYVPNSQHKFLNKDERGFKYGSAPIKLPVDYM